MDKPKCRVCGHKHWSSEDHVYRVQKEEESPQEDGEGESRGVSGDDEGVSPKTCQWRKRNPEKYRKYQREYMRKRRAKS